MNTPTTLKEIERCISDLTETGDLYDECQLDIYKKWKASTIATLEAELKMLEELFKPDIKGEPYQFFKYPVLDTKIFLVHRINELKKSIGGEE